jgi:dTDP-4-amino-4,6-dideoxygalactose transaminase
MRERYRHEILGTNIRLTDIAAAIGLVQLDKLDSNNGRRRSLARRYDELLEEVPVGLPVTPAGREHVFHQYTIAVGPERDRIVAELHAAGIGVGIYYPVPVHRQAYVLERGINADLPVTDLLAATTLSLPMYPALSDDDQRQVVDGLRAALSPAP